MGTPIWRPTAPFWPYLRPFDPICSWVPDGSAHLFFRSFDGVDDFTKHNKSNIAKNRPVSLRVMPI